MNPIAGVDNKIAIAMPSLNAFVTAAIIIFSPSRLRQDSRHQNSMRLNGHRFRSGRECGPRARLPVLSSSDGLSGSL